MSAADHARFPQFDPGACPAIPWDDHLRFCGDDELRDGFFGMGNQFVDQPDLTSPADGPDFSLLHDASPTSPSVHLQPCLDMPTSAGPSALTQGLREWGNAAVHPAVVSPTMDLLSEELIGSCNMADSEPFNPLFLAEGANFMPADNTPSECSSFNSSVGSIPIPQPSQQAFSEYSFCSEPSLGYTGSSFNSDRSFDTLYSAHKQSERLAPPPQNTLALHSQPQVSGWQQQQTKPIHFQRARRLTADQPKRGPPTSFGSGIQKNTLSFIHCRPSEDSRRILTYGAEHSPNGKRPRGRKNPLTPEQKKHAALMRRVKACESCRLRKEKCDPGIPCKACIEHFRTDLVRTPCRGKTLEDLASAMLSGAYTISSEVSFVNLTLGFGPPLLRQVRRVVPTHPDQLIHNHIVYDWPAPRGGETMLSSSPHQDRHSVLPAILADTSDLREELNEHLSKLVNDEQSFRQFPLYNSKLEVLKHVYMFFLGLNDVRTFTDTLKQVAPMTYSLQPTHSHLLRTALKLLVLVHISDHTMLDTSAPLFFTFSRNASDARSMTPCLIRGQLGAVIPTLAQDLLREALSRLEGICLARRCTDWPTALATLATVCMAVESVQYHAAKEPYHAQFNVAPCGKSSGVNTFNRPAALTIPQNPRVVVFGPERPPFTSSAPSSFTTTSSSSSSIHDDIADDFSDGDAASPLSATHEESVDRLIKFYRHCFRGCHCSRLQDFVPTTSASARRMQQQAESQDAVSARFVSGVKASLRSARAYLMQRRVVGASVLRAISGKKEAGARGGGDGGRQEGKLRDMSVFFDRLLAKLFLD
ncbi:hypothetical protein GTA08_BOTSDO02974 [Neofusicoccum parvum]|nr:hypothetical protein GTA08_BOTSDO02974 [Neofusicoccum parvum]